MGASGQGTRSFKRRSTVLYKETIKQYAVIQHCRNEYPVQLMCRCLKVSASGHYAWQDQDPRSPRAQENARLVRRIWEIHNDNRGVIGAPRMHENLLDEGKTVGTNLVARLMAIEHIKAGHAGRGVALEESPVAVQQA